MICNKALIICWDFPPNKAIGGRRWAKISKSLLKLGIEVDVISSRPKRSEGKLAWIENSYFQQLGKHHCNTNVFVEWLNDYKTPLSFIKIRIAKFILSNFYKGTIYDKAIGIEKAFISQISNIVLVKNIDTVFVTGAPFNLIYYAAIFKSKFPHIKIVADYRDPWLGAKNYGMQQLKPFKKQQEIDKQNFVMEHVDVITAPNAFLLDEIKLSYSGSKKQIAKFIELPHAFDPDDIKKTNNAVEQENKVIKILYAGTLYLDIDSHLVLLNDAISELKKHNINVEVDFYCSETNKAKIFENNASKVKFKQPIGDDIFNEIAKSDLLLILLSEHNKNYLTSKFFEYLPYGKPYLYVGPDGFVAKKIQDDDLGYILKSPLNIIEIISQSRTKGQIAHTSQIEQYSFDHVLKQFLQKP